MARTRTQVDDTTDRQTLAFKVWYADYAITGDTFEEWERAESDGVQVVAFYLKEKDKDGKPVKILAHGKDEYALNRQMQLDPNSQIKKTGTNISNKNYEKVIKSAEEDSGKDWILPGVIIKQTPDFGGKMIDVPEGDRGETLSKNRGSK